jgi:hypothetical protein
VREDTLEQERTIVGACLLHPPTWQHARILEPFDFVHPRERIVFEAMKRAESEGVPFDLIALGGLTSEPIPLSYLAELQAEVVTVETIPWHVGRVLERSRGRELQRAILSTAKLPAEDAAEVVAKAAERYQARAVVTDGLPTVQLASVADPGPTRWLIDGVWIAGGVGFVAGEPKTRKSFLTAAMALAVATGRPLLQRYQAQQAPAVIYNAEDRPSETARRLRRMAAAEGVDWANLPIHLVDVPALRLNRPDDCRKLSMAIARIKPGLVVLDPFRNLYDGDEDKSDAVTAALAPLRLMQREHGCAIVVVHHSTKPSEIKRRAGQRMRGSGALHGWGDCNLYVELRGEVSAVEVEQRYSAAIEPFGWKLEDAGEALWCQPCEIPTATTGAGRKAADEDDQQALRSRLLDVLKRGPATLQRLADTARTSKPKAREALLGLLELNKVAPAVIEYQDARGRARACDGWEITR